MPPHAGGRSELRRNNERVRSDIGDGENIVNIGALTKLQEVETLKLAPNWSWCLPRIFVKLSANCHVLEMPSWARSSENLNGILDHGQVESYAGCGNQCLRMRLVELKS